MPRFLLRCLAAAAVALAALVVPVRLAWGAPETRLALLEGTGAPAGQAVGFPATHLGARWSGDDEAVVELRWWAGGAWSPWLALVVAHDLEDEAAGLVYSGVVQAEGAERVQARVAAGRADDVEVAALDTRHGRRRLVRAAPPPAAARSTPVPGRPGVLQPAVVSRAEWGADESLRGHEAPAFAPVTKLIVHHTATGNDDPDPAATVRAVYAFHTQVRGFNDIGYQWLIDASGRIYEGRYSRAYPAGERPTGEDALGRGVVGAHAEGANTGSVGVALLGEFTARGPAAPAVDSLQALLAWAADRHDIDPQGSDPFVRAGSSTTVSFANIAGHRDTRATDCPGDVLYGRLPAIRQAVADTIAAARLVTPGYWLATRDGRVRGFGSAEPLGDLGGAALNSPLRAMAPAPSGRGYWLLGGDGGIFSFGDARFFGSTGALKLNRPVVGMAPTPTGNGYWLVASDGGIFAFGDARFLGSTGALTLNRPVVGMAPTPAGTGYWLVAADGGLFAFGVPFLGSVPELGLASFGGAVAVRASPSGRGYSVLGSDGGLFTFGDALFHGSAPGLSGPGVAVDLALAPPTAALVGVG